MRRFVLGPAIALTLPISLVACGASGGSTATSDAASSGATSCGDSSLDPCKLVTQAQFGAIMKDELANV